MITFDGSIRIELDFVSIFFASNHTDDKPDTVIHVFRTRESL
jgi:hypothetical protein